MVGYDYTLSVNCLFLIALPDPHHDSGFLGEQPGEVFQTKWISLAYSHILIFLVFLFWF